MLQFHQHIIGDLLADSGGGLVVLSSGLGLNKLLSSLIQHHHDASKGTVLVLNATSSSSPLSSHCDNISGSITSDLPVQHRLSLYTSGGVFLITTRILIVDLLTQRLPISSLAGLIILNAHSLSETSTEAFIVRILRGYSNGVNRNDSPLYVWAFTDRPQAMVSGFAKAERILKCLYLRRLHLWPRFHVYVSEDLERAPPEVIDIRVPMSSYMIKIQKAVIEVMDACLKEMRKTNKVDVEDLTVENALFKSFDEIVRRQLDPIWHTLGKRTKQLVSDLKTLRKLLDYLARYDAVTYLKYLDSLRASESFRSVWIFAESSYKIFEYAKKRVYRFGRPDVEKSNVLGKTASTKKRKLEGNQKKDDPSACIETGVVLEEVLEEPPKWKVLRDILVEIQEESQKQVTEGEQAIVGEKGDQGGIVLIACKDESSCMKLEDSIIKGQCQAMREEWEKYLLSKVELHALPKHNKKKPKTTTKGFGILDGVTPSVSGQKAEVSSISKLENDELLAAAHEISKEAKRKSNVEEGNGDGLTIGKTSGNRKKKSKVGKTDPEPKTNIETGNSPPKHTTKKTGHSLLTGDHVSSFKSEHDVNDQLPSLHFNALDSGQIVLDALRPAVIILYHPDMAFVREIEIYKSENPAAKLKVYFLFYEGSTEVRKFEAGISRENGAFESLIRQKSLMMIPVSQDEQLREASTFLEPQAINAQNLLTRKVGGKKEAEKEMRVIVDMREFMSNLPNVLHQKGLRIIPVTLEVGDYILSPLICVERKSIQDLFGSFSSGRLFNQVEMMSRYYRIPVLLIEFSQDKSFSFQSASEISDDVTPNNIISKLSLLVLHFPRLRIVWSRSLHATAEIFAALKANQDEPDEAKAIRVGVPSEDGVIEDDVRAENYNTSAVEFLRRLPGVTDSNYSSIMDGCKSLSELALLPMEKLARLMGGHKAAKTLRDFLDAKYPTLL